MKNRKRSLVAVKPTCARPFRVKNRAEVHFAVLSFPGPGLYNHYLWWSMLLPGCWVELNKFVLIISKYVPLWYYYYTCENSYLVLICNHNCHMTIVMLIIYMCFESKHYCQCRCIAIDFLIGHWQEEKEIIIEVEIVEWQLQERI